MIAPCYLIDFPTGIRPIGQPALPSRTSIYEPGTEEDFRAQGSILGKVEHPFRVVKQQFGYARIRYRGLAQSTMQLTILVELGNL